MTCRVEAYKDVGGGVRSGHSYQGLDMQMPGPYNTNAYLGEQVIVVDERVEKTLQPSIGALLVVGRMLPTWSKSKCSVPN
jgi:hypothetical protein